MTDVSVAQDQQCAYAWPERLQAGADRACGMHNCSLVLQMMRMRKWTEQ